jgi:hypothetical protein
LKGSGNERYSKNTDLNDISPHDVKQVLDASYFAQSLPRTSLQSTFFFQMYVQERLSLDMPQSETLEDFLLIELLHQQIRDELAFHREVFELPMPSRDASLKETLCEFTGDFEHKAAELEAWSVLYFRYVRVELGLTWQQIEAATMLPERTLRRRQQRGILRLTHQLIAEELAIRQRRDSQWLHLAHWATSEG